MRTELTVTVASQPGLAFGRGGGTPCVDQQTAKAYATCLASASLACQCDGTQRDEIIAIWKTDDASF